MSKVNENVRNVHLIEARYSGPTNTKGARVRLTSQRFERDSIADGYDYESGGTLGQAERVLRNLGYEILFHAETPKGYAIAVADFKPLRESLAAFKAGGAA